MLFRIHWTLMLHLYNEDSSLKLRLVSRMRISTISGVFKPVYSLSFLCLCNARMLNYESFPDKVRLMNKKSQNMAVPDFPHCTQTFFSVETPLQNTLVITWPGKKNPDSHSGSTCKIWGWTPAARCCSKMLEFLYMWPRRESMMRCYWF